MSKLENEPSTPEWHRHRKTHDRYEARWRDYRLAAWKNPVGANISYGWSAAPRSKKLRAWGGANGMGAAQGLAEAAVRAVTEHEATCEPTCEAKAPDWHGKIGIWESSWYGYWLTTGIRIPKEAPGYTCDYYWNIVQIVWDNPPPSPLTPTASGKAKTLDMAQRIGQAAAEIAAEEEPK